MEHLPNELQRNFTLMRELDSRAQTLMKSIDEKADEFMSTLVKDKDSIPEEVRKEKLKAIQDMFNKAKEYGDDKVQLAIQTYELVDKHIRRLDSDLARFEGEIQDKTLTTAKTTKTDEPVKRESRIEFFLILCYDHSTSIIIFFVSKAVANALKTSNCQLTRRNVRQRVHCRQKMNREPKLLSKRRKVRKSRR